MANIVQFVKRAVKEGTRRTINDHMHVQGIKDYNERRGLRTNLYRKLLPGEEYGDYLGSIFVPSYVPRGQQPKIARYCEPEADEFDYEPTSNEIQVVQQFDVANYAFPQTALLDAVANRTIATLSKPKQVAITNAAIQKNHEIEVSRMKQEYAEQVALAAKESEAQTKAQLTNILDILSRVMPQAGAGANGGAVAVRSGRGS